MKGLLNTELQELLLPLWAVLALARAAAGAGGAPGSAQPHTAEHGAARAARNVGFLMDFGICQVKDSRKHKYFSIGGLVFKTAGNE